MRIIRSIVTMGIIALFVFNSLKVNAQSEWSEWIDSVPEEIGDDYDIEERTIYRFRDKQTTNSTQSSLDGWTQYDSKVTYGSWGDWSAYSSTVQTKSDTKDVRTDTYYRYYWYYCPVCGSYEPLTGWSDCGKYNLTSADFHTMWIAWQYAPTDSHSFSYASNIKYTDKLVPEHRVCFAAGNLYDTTPGTKDANGSGAVVIATWYSYRTRTKTTTYYYFKWSDWSEWSNNQPEEKDDREIETAKQYRYKNKAVSMDYITVSGMEKTYVYTGEAIIPKCILTYNNYELVKDEDYVVDCDSNINVGVGKITYTGLGKYHGTIEETYTIIPIDISSANVLLSVNNYTYSGQAITPTPIVLLNGNQLILGRDYSIIYSNNINVGNAGLTVKGVGNYTGEKKTEFLIEKSQELTVQVPATENPVSVQETAQAGKVSLVTMDEQEETELAGENGGTDSGVKIKKQTGNKGDSNKKVTKGTVFESKKAKYKVSNVKNKTVVYVASNNKGNSEIKVPDTIKYNKKEYKVTEITAGAFKNNKKLKRVVIGRNIKKIGKNAFRGCKNLKSVTIGKNVVSIGSYAFYGDKKLSVINFGTRKLNKVGKGAFKKISKHPKAKVPREKLYKYQRMIKKAL